MIEMQTIIRCRIQQGGNDSDHIKELHSRLADRTENVPREQPGDTGRRKLDKEREKTNSTKAESRAQPKSRGALARTTRSPLVGMGEQTRGRSFNRPANED